MLTQVHDIYCAAFLLAKGCEVQKMGEAEDGFINFFFLAREAGPALSEWYEPTANVNIHDYLAALKQLRGAVKRFGRK